MVKHLTWSSFSFWRMMKWQKKHDMTMVDCSYPKHLFTYLIRDCTGTYLVVQNKYWWYERLHEQTLRSMKWNWVITHSKVQLHAFWAINMHKKHVTVQLFSINCFVSKTSVKSEKCPSQFPRAQSDIFRCPVLSD